MWRITSEPDRAEPAGGEGRAQVLAGWEHLYIKGLSGVPPPPHPKVGRTCSIWSGERGVLSLVWVWSLWDVFLFSVLKQPEVQGGVTDQPPSLRIDCSLMLLQKQLFS